MLKRFKNILVLLVILLLSGGVYMWFYPLNKGGLKIMANTAPYYIIEGDNQTFCETDPCEIVLKSGFYHLEIRKDGHLTETINISIKRGETEETPVVLKKIPTLQPAQTAPPENGETHALPEALRTEKVVAPVWDPFEKRLAFWDSEDEKVKLWEESGIRPIAALKNMEEGLKWYWSPDGNQLIGVLKTDIYFIDPEKASRKKIISEFPPRNISWSPTGNYLLTNNSEGALYKIDPNEKVMTAMGQTLDLKNAVWEDGDTLIYFTYDEEKNESLIESFNVAEQETKVIIREAGFKIEKVLAKKGKMIYFYNPSEAIWYQLTY